MNEGTLPAARALLADLVALPGPPGQENAVRDYVAEHARALGYEAREDAKGNLLVPLGDSGVRPTVVVTAHLDEIALLVTRIEADGALQVTPLGGAHVWKWGERPVEVIGKNGAFVPGVLSLGSIHTTAPGSVAQAARAGAIPDWPDARVVTGRAPADLARAGVRPGARVVLARARRALWDLGEDDVLTAAYFLDDRADLVAWLLALEALRGRPGFENVVFAATASEEVGGEGALFLLHETRPDVCVALEIGPRTPDADLPLGPDPTVWVTDTFATMDPRDLDLLDDAAAETGLTLYPQAVTRGGSDASCAASRGLCARPVTLAFAADNSHGFEIMHRDSPQNLARLLVAYLDQLHRETAPPRPT